MGERNEKKMWSYLIENKLLFSTDFFTINKFINDGPFTKDFSNESPARAANWIGLQIVNSYRKNNSDVNLEELMKNNNVQEILTLSKYSP